jgi:Arc/MetJ family transcription regulator
MTTGCAWDSFSSSTAAIQADKMASTHALDLRTDVYVSCIYIQMRTTLNIDDHLLKEAARLTGIAEKTAVIRAGLQALIARESARRLAALGGSEPGIQAVPRRRPRSRNRQARAR